MDSVGKEEKLNINILKMKKSFSSISPFRQLGGHDQQTMNIGFNRRDRAEQ